MARRVASAGLELFTEDTEVKGVRRARIIGYDQLWMLKAHLDALEPVAEIMHAG